MNLLQFRIARMTLCVAVVATLGSGGPRAGADEAPTPESDLRLASRMDAPKADRIDAAKRLLATAVPDAEAGVRAASLLLRDDAATAAALLRKSLDAEMIPADTLDLARSTARAALSKETDPVRRASLAAFALGTGLRGEEFQPALAQPDAPGVAEASAADSFNFPWTVPGVAEAWKAHRVVADRLDRASADDPAVARAAISNSSRTVPSHSDCCGPSRGSRRRERRPGDCPVACARSSCSG